MDQLAGTIREDIKRDRPFSPELFGQVRRFRVDYLALRETFFRLAFVHASGIVERLERQNQHAVLRRTSISLVAGTELVKNFHTTGATISLHPLLRELWNESDPTRGIPEQSWEESLETSRKAVYRNLFSAGIERLRNYQRQLERYWDGGDGNFLSLYPNGIEPGLQEMEENVAFLEEDLVEEYSGEDERELQKLVKESKRVRALWVQRAHKLREATERGRGLIRGDVRLEVYDAEKTYLSLRESLYRLAFKHLPKLTRQDIPYPPELRLRGIGISLLAAVTLYENAQEVQNQILTVPELRTILNQSDPVRGIPPHFWDRVHREFVRVKYRRLLEAGLRKWEELRSVQQGPLIQDDPFLAYVQAELANNPMVAEIRREPFFGRMARGFGFHTSRAIKFMSGSIGGGGKFQASKAFSNLIGMVTLREGKLYGKTAWEEFVKARLKPGDILLEKTPFRLTDRFIPGHFGHAALYVGTEKELRDLDLLSQPYVRRHLPELSQDKTIAEALRNGTQLSSLKTFLNIDDLAILRPKADAIPRANVRAAISLAFSHLGKTYDFKFDANTWETITCSELIFQSYIHVPWSYGRVLSSYTVSPDDIAIFAGSDNARPFSLITFIHDGQLIHDLPTGLHNEDLYIRLLGGHYAEAIPSDLIASRLGESSSLTVHRLPSVPDTP